MLGLYEEETKLAEDFWEAIKEDMNSESPPSLEELTEKFNQFFLPKRQEKIKRFIDSRALISFGISRASSFIGKLFLAVLVVLCFHAYITDVLNIDTDMTIFRMIGYVSLALLVGVFLLKIYKTFFDYQTKRFLKIAEENPSYTDFLHFKLKK